MGAPVFPVRLIYPLVSEKKARLRSFSGKNAMTICECLQVPLTRNGIIVSTPGRNGSLPPGRPV